MASPHDQLQNQPLQRCVALSLSSAAHFCPEQVSSCLRNLTTALPYLTPLSLARLSIQSSSLYSSHFLQKYLFFLAVTTSLRSPAGKKTFEIAHRTTDSGSAEGHNNRCLLRTPLKRARV